MKETMVALLYMSSLTGCAGLTVPDILTSIENLRTECHGLVSRLAGNGYVGVDAAECDKAALDAKDRLVELLDQLRARLAKAGVQ